MPPQVIAGRYRVEKEIGRGGMGSVWLCRDELLGRVVAVKQIGLMPGESTTDLARAMREARSTAALNHPHVVSVFDAVEEGEHAWLVMEYVPGRTLAELLAEEGPLPPDRVAHLGAQVADGLAAAHARGIVHRDVKPGNVLVTDDDRAMISDFGIARTHGDATLTRSGMVTGTPSYFSPELARGGDPTPATDVWALGASLYAAVEGHPPFTGHGGEGNALALLARIAHEPVPAPTRAGFLTDALGRMLDPDPATRWEMADAAQSLRRLHERHGHGGTREQTAPVAALVPPAEPAAEPAPAPPVTPPRRRRGAWPVLLALLAVLAAAGLGWLAIGHVGDRGSTAGPAAPSTSRHSAGSPTRSSSGTTQTSPTSPSSSGAGSTGASPVPAAHGMLGVPRSYYRLLPDDTRAGWAMLTPGFRRDVGGYGKYRGFWDTISTVDVGDVSRAGSGAVDVDLTYTRDDGSTSSETRRLFLQRSGDGWVLTGDQVVS